MVELPAEFRTTPFAYYVWSRSLRAGHVLAFAIARFVDPAFRWMSIRETSDLASEEERWVRRLLPRDRLIEPLVGSSLGPAPRVRRETFNALIQSEGAETERVALDHFLMLPERLQSVLDERVPTPTPRAIVVSNTNRVREFYPTEPERLRAFMDVFPRSGLSIVATSVPPPYKGRYGFDIVLRLNVTTGSDWRTAHLVVEKGLHAGAFQTGTTYPTDELPWYLEVGTSVEQSLG